MADESNPSLSLLKFAFSADGAKAFLGNTRNMLFGWDQLGGLSDAANSTPGGFPWGALDFLNTQREPDSNATVSDAPGPNAPGGAVYDCATGKCSDGRALGFSRWLDRMEACSFRGPGPERDRLLADICSDSPAMQKSDGTTGQTGVGGWDSILGYGSKLAGIDEAKFQHYGKRAVFALLAIVIIYAALRSVLKG